MEQEQPGDRYSAPPGSLVSLDGRPLHVTADGRFAFGFAPDQIESVAGDGALSRRQWRQAVPSRPRSGSMTFSASTACPSTPSRRRPEVRARIAKEARGYFPRPPRWTHRATIFLVRLRLARARHSKRYFRQPAHRQWRADGAALWRGHGRARGNADPRACRWGHQSFCRSFYQWWLDRDRSSARACPPPICIRASGWLPQGERVSARTSHPG